MSTDTRPITDTSEDSSRENDRVSKADWARWFKPLASLKLTVCLFALSVFLIFAGTLAQAEIGMWDVISKYFTSWIVLIDFRVLFPLSFFPNRPNMVFSVGSFEISGFPFPGGATIGSLMAVNLLAAHLLRFRVQAKGGRLAAGVITMILGAGVTALVVMSGNNPDGLQGEPLLGWEELWNVLLGAMVLLWLGLAAGFVMMDKAKRLELWACGGAATVLGLFLAWVFLTGFELGSSSMRILWQLVQGEVSAIVLLVGCWLLFKKRGGIVLLHLGVGLLMLGGVLSARYAVEEKMRIAEGQTVNYTFDIRSVELALVDSSDPAKDHVVVVPESQLTTSNGAARQTRVESPDLPVDIKVEQYIRNASLRDVAEGDKNLASSGEGLRTFAEPAPTSAGADADGRVDLPSAYVSFFKKGSDEPLETLLVSTLLAEEDQPEKLRLDGKVYDVYLRFKRAYKPYEITLLDVSKDDYMGTSTPRSYESSIRLVDPTRDQDRELRIWMNNPMRYGGETFYQANYFRTAQGELTEFQVVLNTGWMIPYIACMIVATGMFVQFGQTLIRFLRRRADEQVRVAKPKLPPEDFNAITSRSRKLAKAARGKRGAVQEPTPDLRAVAQRGDFSIYIIPGVFVALGLALLTYQSAKGIPEWQGYDLQRVANVPIMYEGRVKPLDTLARNSLLIISNRSYFKDDQDRSQPAIRWLLDVITGRDEANEHRVVKIDNMEVQALLELPRRQGHRYAISELRGRLSEFLTEAEKASRQNPKQLSTFQKKVLELDRRLRHYMMLVTSFQLDLPQIPNDPNMTDQQKQMLAVQFMQDLSRRIERLRAQSAPLAVPTSEQTEDGKTVWKTYAETWLDAARARIQGKEPDPAALAWTEIINAYYQGKTSDFNNAVVNYQRELDDHPPTQMNPTRLMVETYMNTADPFTFSSTLYLLALVLAIFSWMMMPGSMSRSSASLIALAWIVHTFALIARIYISGRPPVTNLYSSAVFIGWGCVAMGMMMERVTRMSIGSAVSAATGFFTLLVAYQLAADGDTFTVLVAVLDTQFWLTTHVLCVTLGYSATLLAGSFGVAYLMAGWFTGRGSKFVELERLVYGVACFGLFFSFVGTVLGGLWADDSWGRFWGWDPKENGALMIVLWNALLLHARWGKMVAGRGMAILAVIGNIVTAWSWFGTNELGIGLHSYGFTEGRLLALGLFVLAHVAIIIGGLLYWPTKAEAR